MFSLTCSLCCVGGRSVSVAKESLSALTLHSSRRAATHPPHNLIPSLQPPQRKLQETGTEKHLQMHKSEDQLKLMQLDEPGSPYTSSVPETSPPQ